MKKGTAILLVLLTLVGLASAEVSSKKLEQAEKAYKLALQSDNAGVRNSALKQIVVLTSQYPDFDAYEFTSLLKKMSNKDDKAYIRVNAKMTLDLLKDKDLIEHIDTEEIDPKVFFNDVYNKLNNFFAAR